MHTLLMKTKDLLKILKDNGWELFRVKGSHHQYKKTGFRTIPVPVHGKEISDQFAKIILKQAGIE